MKFIAPTFPRGVFPARFNFTTKTLKEPFYVPTKSFYVDDDSELL